MLAPHKNDVKTLCAAACVARAWRVAAREPGLWHTPRLSNKQIELLSPERLSFILATGGVNVLDLSTGSCNDHADMLSADMLTARDLADALAGAPPLEALRVAGLKLVPSAAAFNPVTCLTAAVQYASRLDVVGGGSCGAMIDGAACSRLCTSEQLRCEPCGLYACEPCVQFYRKRRSLLLSQGCRHLCVGCWELEDWRGFRVCEECPQDSQCPDDAGDQQLATARPYANQFCKECLRYCNRCEYYLCFKCRGDTTCGYCNQELCKNCVFGQCYTCEYDYCEQCVEGFEALISVDHDGGRYCETCRQEPMEKARARKEQKKQRKKEAKDSTARERANVALATLALSPTETALTAAIGKLEVATLRVCILRLSTAPPPRSLLKPALCAALLRLLLPRLGGAAGATAPEAPTAGA